MLDNRAIILQDPRVRETSLHNLGLILNHTYWWPLTESGLYRPFTTLTYLFNYAILGNRDQPAGYHWLNFLLHAGNVLLVYALARRLLRDFWPPVFVAGLWAVHPVLTESITNVVGRADLIAAMATLSGFLMYLRSTETSGGRRLAWLAGLGAVTTAGVFAKESAVAIVGVIAVYELIIWDRRRLADFLAACYVLSLPFFAMWYLRWRALGAASPAEFAFLDNPTIGASFLTGRLAAIGVLGRYIGLLVWPVRLSSDYSYSQIPVSGGGWHEWMWITLAAAPVAAWLLLRRRPAFSPAIFAAGFAAVCILPASNLVVPIGTIMAERFLYLASFGWAVWLVMAAYWVARRVRFAPLAPVALCLIAAGFSMRTWARNADWRDDVSLWTAATQTSPNSFKAHTLLAQWLHTGQADITRVLAQEERSMSILAAVPDAVNDPGVFRRAGADYIEKGDLWAQIGPGGKTVGPPLSIRAYEQAVAALLRAVSIIQAHDAIYFASKAGTNQVRGVNVHSDVYRLLSHGYLRLGNTDRALWAVKEAHARMPLSPDVYRQMQEVLLSTGSGGEARAALMEGVILTGDAGLKRMALDTYRDSGAQDCTPDLACAVARDDACAVSEDALRSVLNTGRRDLAFASKHEFLWKFGCPAGPLDAVLPD